MDFLPAMELFIVKWKQGEISYYMMKPEKDKYLTFSLFLCFDFIYCVCI